MLANTNPYRADTDGDGVGDFEEILTFTSHDRNLHRRPVDHGIRVLVTSSSDCSASADAYLHLMLRFVNLSVRDVAFHGFYAHVGGHTYSLAQLLGYSEVRVQQWEGARGEAMFLFSIRLASEDDLKRILPCTIGAKAVVAGKYINTGSYLTRDGSDIATLMPYTSQSMILQPVNTAAYDQEALC